MIEEPIAVVCTGHGRHTLRELVVLVPVRPRGDLALLRREAGIPEPAPTSDERRGFGVAGSVTTFDGEQTRRRSKSAAQLVDTPDVGWQVLHPGCPTCHSPLVLPLGQVLASLTAFPRHDAAGRLEVDVRPA